jgi:hypothetical protein
LERSGRPLGDPVRAGRPLGLGLFHRRAVIGLRSLRFPIFFQEVTDHRLRQLHRLGDGLLRPAGGVGLGDRTIRQICRMIGAPFCKFAERSATALAMLRVETPIMRAASAWEQLGKFAELA